MGIKKIPIKLIIAIIISFSFQQIFAEQVTSNASQKRTASLSQSSMQAKKQSSQEIEHQRSQSQNDLKKLILQESLDAVKETEKAITAIDTTHKKEALEAIERAIGKITVLLATHPENALLPINSKATVVDFAPNNIDEIWEIRKDVEHCINMVQYPDARALLDRLRSELVISIYNLPLIFFDEGLKEAARLLELNKTQECKEALQDLLKSFAIINKIFPLPVLNAKEYIEKSEKELAKDPKAALQLLTDARAELGRAKALGYAGKNPEYESLNKAIRNLEHEINNNTNGKVISFIKLKDKISNFLKAAFQELKPDKEKDTK